VVRRTWIVAFAVCAAACTSAPVRSLDATSLPVADSSVLAGGVALHVRSVGPTQAARTVITVHGGPGLSLQAMSPYDGLAGSARRVVGYDQRGTGRSAVPADGDYSLASQVADLEAVRVATKATTVDLIGESWGGAIAAAYTAAHPDRVRSLVLVGAVPLDRAEYRAGQQRFSARVRELQMAGLIVDPVPANAEGSCLPSLAAVLPAYVADPRSVPRVSIGTCTSATSHATATAFVDDSTVEHQGELLGDYTGGALLVMGDHDAFGLEWLHRNVELLTSAKVTQDVVVSAGHLVTAEHPVALLAAIDAFLSAARTRR
jgi:proline iminopeptidase